MSQFVIQAAGIRKSYRTAALVVPVLGGVDLQVEQGECLYLAGPSGSGKSTLLSILGCLLTPDEGELTVLGERVDGWDSRRRAKFRRERIGFVFQRFHLVAGLRAWENVRIPLDLLGWKGNKGRDEANRLLGLVGLGDKVDRHVHELSLGQRQRVALARALAGNPELIFADEPTASLDFESGHQAMKILRDLANQLGKTVVVVTHDARIYPMADRILTLEDGRFTMVRYNAKGKMGPMVQKL